QLDPLLFSKPPAPTDIYTLSLHDALPIFGLKAMSELQTLNPTPDRATDDMIMFMVINASSVTVLPISIFTFRAQLGAKDPTDVLDRKSTRLNSSHEWISYAVFCLKKKKTS